MNVPSNRELAVRLAHAKNIPLEQAQRIVAVLADRASKSAEHLPPDLRPRNPNVIPGSAEHLQQLLRDLPPGGGATQQTGGSRTAPTHARPAVPSLRELSVRLAHERNIPLADAQAIVYVAARNARQAG